jgi:hypothetical protein
MKNIIISSILAMLAMVPLVAQSGVALEEAAPMISILRAVQISDIDSFQQAYSKEIREDKEQGDWKKNMTEAQKNMARIFGAYRLADFSFSFKGSREKGVLTVQFKMDKTINLKVVKEEAGWKLDER